MQTYINPFKQNNDYTSIICKIRFRSSFKQTRTCFQEILRPDVVHLGINYLYGKYCPRYAGIPPS